jgi:hypothetical protein
MEAQARMMVMMVTIRAVHFFTENRTEPNRTKMSVFWFGFGF